MSFYEMAKTRYSARKYSSKKVEPEKLEKILEAGRIAPTAVNKQPQRIIVVQSDKGREIISGAAHFYDAPVGLIVCADFSESWVRRYDGKNSGDIDASIVTSYMMLEARDLGVDSLWICSFDPEKIKAGFNLPDNIVPVNILALGYADCEAASPQRYSTARKPLSETVFYEKYN